MSKGIDIPIDALIDQLNSGLWIGNNNQFYGRVFRNKIHQGIQVIYYDGIEGLDPLKNDFKDAQCFVDVLPERKANADIFEAECRIVFMVNLSAIYPSLNRSEAIESVMTDVVNELMSSQFELTRVISGAEALEDYVFADDTSIDISSDHAFRFDTKLIYTNS